MPEIVLKGEETARLQARFEISRTSSRAYYLFSMREEWAEDNSYVNGAMTYLTRENLEALQRFIGTVLEEG